MNKKAKIYIAGHNGLVGASIMKKLKEEGYNNLIFKSHKELNLKIQSKVEFFFKKEKPEYVFLAAAKVGGIYANDTYPAEFIYDNIMIESNVIHSAYKFGVKKLLFLGSSCIYPKYAKQPIKEEYLLSGYLEPTNEAYAIAKIAGLKMCEFYNKQYKTNFMYIMPTNIYGPNDNFDLKTSHVLSALLRKINEAKINNKPYIEIWGTGVPRREFLYVDDLADACVFLMNNYDKNELINIGVGRDITIQELAELIIEIVGYKGEIKFDTSKPDGTPQKLLDTSKLNKLGWSAKTGLREGIEKSNQWFRNNFNFKNDG